MSVADVGLAIVSLVLDSMNPLGSLHYIQCDQGKQHMQPELTFDKLSE